MTKKTVFEIIIKKNNEDHPVLVDYSFKWLARWSWCLWTGKNNKTSYAIRGVRGENNKIYQLHLQRFVAFALPGERVSFLNGRSLDCRRENLLINNECVMDIDREILKPTNFREYLGMYV